MYSITRFNGGLYLWCSRQVDHGCLSFQHFGLVATYPEEACLGGLNSVGVTGQLVLMALMVVIVYGGAQIVYGQPHPDLEGVGARPDVLERVGELWPAARHFHLSDPDDLSLEGGVPLPEDAGQLDGPPSGPVAGPQGSTHVLHSQPPHTPGKVLQGGVHQ